MIIVCDANTARETSVFRKKGGAELLTFLRNTNRKLYLPAILEKEYLEQTSELVEQIQQQVADAHVRLSDRLALLGSLTGTRLNPFKVDGVSNISAKVDRLYGLETLVDRPDLAEGELILAAGKRSIEKQPPVTATNHGFKDCMIWECILRLPAGSDVRLVTNDGGFYDDDGLHKELFSEAEAKGIKVMAYRHVADFLKDPGVSASVIDETPVSAADLVETKTITSATLDPGGGTPSIRENQPAKLDSKSLDVDTVKGQLATAQLRFENIDAKVLGFVSYLDGTGKRQLFELLDEAGVPADVAANVAHRLVIMGFLKDTGTVYLLADRSMGKVMAPTVETEIIELLRKRKQSNGS